MRFASTCIAVAVAAAIGGLALQPLLGAALLAAQTYLSLLGWMAMGLYGIYYCSPGPILHPRLAWSQLAAATLGFLAIKGGAAAGNATGDARFGAVVLAGALLSALGLGLFLTQVVVERRPARRTYA